MLTMLTSDDTWTCVHSFKVNSSNNGVVGLSVPKCAIAFQEINANSTKSDNKTNTNNNNNENNNDNTNKSDDTNNDKCDNKGNNSPQPVHLVVSYLNGTVGFIDTRTHEETFTEKIPLKSDETTGTTKLKRRRFVNDCDNEYIVSLDQSNTGAIGVGITNLCRLAVFRQSSLKRISFNNNNTNDVDSKINEIKAEISTESPVNFLSL
jgi:hypothetical protein